MTYHLILSRAQAGALSRLIQTQLEAYEEAAGHRQPPSTRKPSEPFTGADLDLIEPLVVLLEKLSSP